MAIEGDLATWPAEGTRARPGATARGCEHSAGQADGLTRVLARELRGRDITVKAVAPGLEPSPTAAEVAGLVALLAGPEGRLLSGQVIPAPALLRQPSAAGRAYDGVDRPASRDRGA